MKRRGALLALLLALTLGGVTRADISFTNLGGGGCSTNCSISGTTTLDRLKVTAGSVYTCSVAGAGTGATCTRNAGTDSAGNLSITTGTTATANVTLTITFSAAMGSGGEPAYCMAVPRNVGGGGTWNAAVTVRMSSAGSDTTCVFLFANTAALTDGTEYQVVFLAIGR